MSPLVECEKYSVESDINKRRTECIPHHPRSLALMRSISEIDSEMCHSYLCRIFHNNNQVGETWLYELDIHHELEEARLKSLSINLASP